MPQGVLDLGQHWFGQRIVACSAPSHYLSQFWPITKWNVPNKLQWNCNKDTYSFFHENENVLAAVLAMLNVVTNQFKRIVWNVTSVSFSFSLIVQLWVLERKGMALSLSMYIAITVMS